MRFEKYLSEAPIGTKGWTKKSVEKFGKTIGKSPDSHGFFDACVKRMQDDMGDRVKGFCASLKDTWYGSPNWRGKAKSKKEIKKDIKKDRY